MPPRPRQGTPKSKREARFNGVEVDASKAPAVIVDIETIDSSQRVPWTLPLPR